MRKIAGILAVLLVFILLNQKSAADQTINPNVFIDKSSINSGLISMKYSNRNNKRMKIIIENDKNKYTYNLITNNTLESFPLQMGNGDYKLGVYENIEGKIYKPVYSEVFGVNIKKENNVYLNSIQLIKWDPSMKAVKKARELSQGTKSEEQKIKVIYDFVVNNFSYDYSKFNKLETTYLPDIDEIFASRKGICFDYASMFAGMLRSVGIPAKLVKGYTSNSEKFHAWNEVYNSNSKRWIVIDTTYDSQMIASKLKVNMEKETGAYSKLNEY